MPNKKLMIINEKINISKYLKFIDSSTSVVAWNYEVCQDLKKRKINHKPINVKYNQDVAVRWTKDLARICFNRKSLISAFEFEGTSLWWWMEYWLYSSFAYYNPFEEIIKVFCIIYDTIKKENPDEIVYVKEGKLHDKTIKLIAKKLRIKTRIIESPVRAAQFKIAKKIKMILIKNFFDARRILRKKAWNTLSAFKKKKIIETKDKKKILFIYGHSPRSKPYLQPIFEKLEKNKCILYALDVGEGTDFLNLKIFREKIKDAKLKNVLFESYTSKRDIKKVSKINKKLKELWNSLKNNSRFRQIFELKGINIWGLVEPQFSCYFDVRLKDHLINFIGIENVIKSVNPDIAVTLAETTEFDKGLFLACQKRKIPSVAIQHGIFTDLRCMHEYGEVSLKEIKPRYCPVPAITAVYGGIYKRFLIEKGKYPPSSIVITGNQRYDSLANANKVFDKKEIYKELKLDPNKKVVVMATEVSSSIKDTELFVKMVSDAVKKIKGVQLVVKVHPNQTIRYYDKLFKDNKVDAVITKYNIFKVVYACDVLLLVRSTVGLEAAILNKPIVTINSIEGAHSVDYSREGVAIASYNAENLSKSIKAALYDRKAIAKLAKNRKRYVYEHCYKIDGKSSERIARLIEDILKRR